MTRARISLLLLVLIALHYTRKAIVCSESPVRRVRRPARFDFELGSWKIHLKRLCIRSWLQDRHGRPVL